VNFLNIGSRQTQNATLSSLRAVSQTFSKLFNSRVSTPFGTTLQELETSQMANQGAAPNSAERQNLVAMLSNSRATRANASGLAAGFGNSISNAATPGNTPETAATGLIEQIIAGQQASGTPRSISQPSDSTVTPAAAPTPYTPGQANSTDPSVYSTMDYSEAMNLSANEVQANDENGRRYANYLNEFQNWQMNGSQGQPPQPPVYETVDQNGFQKWWSEYQQNMSSGDFQPPDVSMFLINAPDYGNGYYGAAGSTQVGTLYNPTGPATADQVQAANNSSATQSIHGGTNS
jgi:hypothetical protein